MDDPSSKTEKSGLHTSVLKRQVTLIDKKLQRKKALRTRMAFYQEVTGAFATPTKAGFKRRS